MPGPGRASGPLLSLSLLAAVLAALARPDPAAAGVGKRGHRASVTEGLDCGACHVPDGWKSVGSASGSSGFDHSRTGFPLTQRHRQVPCTGCHNAEQTLTRRCAGCHQDEHQGRLGSRCDSCHSAVSFRQTDAIVRHRSTRLPLSGMHAVTECRDCHRRTSEAEWSSVPADCFACHASDYRRVDVHPPHVGVPGDPDNPPFPRDCTQCHRATGWVPAFVPPGFAIDAFEPTASAGLAPKVLGAPSRAGSHEAFFPIESGAHRGSACRDCHVSPTRSALVRCDGCHAHGEARLRVQHREVLGFGASCLACHPGGRAR